MNEESYLHTTVPVVNKRVHRLGLALNYGIDGKGAELAVERGLNYFFWSKFRKGDQFRVVKEALTRDREGCVLHSGVPLGYTRGSVRRSAEKLLRTFDIEYIDVFQLFWLGKMSAFTESVQQELWALKKEGLARAVGISIHDRKRAGHLVLDSPLDLFMLRYNAAHPGAETDIFPNYATRRPATVAYTATSWRKLLKAPKGWDGQVMTAGDCYRWCLNSPHVDVVLTGPKTTEQLVENLEQLEKGPLSSEEDAWMREFGRVVHGKR